MNKRFLKGITALLTASVMSGELLLSDAGNIDIPDFSIFNFVSDIYTDAAEYKYTLSNFDTSVVDAANNIIKVGNADQLVMLSFVDPQEYQYYTINITNIGSDIEADKEVTASDSSKLSFQGLGSEDYPFCGKISVTESCQYYKIVLNRALFCCIDSQAKVLYNNAVPFIRLKGAAGNTYPLFADCVKGGAAAADWTVYAEGDFGGIIGTLDENSAAVLDVKCMGAESSLSADYKSSSAGNTGFYCGTMKSGSSLTVKNGADRIFGKTLPETINFSVTSKGASAGAFAGVMEQGSSLSVDESINKISATVSGIAAAGGIAGSGKDCNLTIADSGITSSCNVSGAAASGGIWGSYISSDGVSAFPKMKLSGTVTGTDNAGGLAGTYEVSGSDEYEMVLSPETNVDLSACNIKATTNAGGAFGTLTNSNTSGISIKGEIKTASLTDAVTGGVTGLYNNAAGLQSALVLGGEGDSTQLSVTGDTVSGGLIGSISGDSYVKAENCSVKMTSAEGGLFGTAGEAMLDVCGTNTISSKITKGGIINNMTDGAVRLSGKTDFTGDDVSGIEIDKDNKIIEKVVGQIANTRGNAVIYAEKDWQFYRGNAAETSDIADYGEVVRTDSLNGLFTFDEYDHTVTVKGFDCGNISDKLDFAALSVSMQATKSGDVLKLTNTVTPSANIITLTGNIDLTGTGITGLMRDNGALASYSGIFDGDNHKITMAAGETYGFRGNSAASGNGSGQIYSHGYGGLFAETGGSAVVRNLTAEGSTRYNVKNNVQYTGGIAAYAEGNCTFNNVSAYVDMTSSGDQNAAQNIGGIVGYSKAASLKFNNCVWGGKITDTSVYSADELYTIGGFVGASDAVSVINISGCTTHGTIDDRCARANGISGGLIAKIQNGCTLNINGLDVGCTVTTNAAATSGGLLGWDWEDTTAVIKNVEINGASLTSVSSSFGGLVYAGSGYWHIENGSGDGTGIRFSGTNTVNGNSSAENVSGLIVCRGNGFRAGKYLYLSLDADSYRIDENAVTLTIDTVYFDEICGNSIGDNFSGSNGVVSIGTASGYIDKTGCNTYINQINDFKNSNTRYYYNIDKFRDGAAVDCTEVDSAEKLVCWSLYHYAGGNIRDYFAKNVGSKITGTIDLTGYSYYPVCIANDITIENADITFANKTIEDAETAASNKKPSDNERQHYMMQYGLFIDFTSTTDKANTLTVKNTSLSGSFGNDEDYSGALVCRNIEGVVNGLNTYQASVDIDGLKLDGIKAVNTDKPLLIKSIPNYAKLIFNDVYTTPDSYEMGGKAAGSLIGTVGTEQDGKVTTDKLTMTFTNMGLDSRTEAQIYPMYGTYGTIFTNALFAEKFIYPNDSTTCGGQYTFEKDKDNEKITYGKEISNNAVHGGRNPGEQYCYFNSNVAVTYDGITADVGDGFFTDKFLRYIGKQEDFANYHEIDINQSVFNFKGCGTYSDPYIITRGKELEQLADYLNGISKNGFELNFDKTNLANTKMQDQTEPTDTKKHIHVKYLIDGGKWSDPANGTALGDAMQIKIKQYLRNAYYLITDDITLGNNGKFFGIGGSDVTNKIEGNSFCGVIAGKKLESGEYPTITVKCPDSTEQRQYGGLIKYSNGSVVKDLTIRFDTNGTVTINSDSIPEQLIDTTKTNQTSKMPAYQVFFGGVIGYAIGGDNIIDNVTVNQPPIDVTGEYDYMANVGGYVGLLGGSITEGGGVIFRNLSDENHSFVVKGVDTYDNVETSNDKLKGNQILDTGNQYFYWNPYIGRVLDGFALAEGCTVNNTDKNYRIHRMSENGGKIAFGTDGTSTTLGTVSVKTPEQLWILSAIVNSGAGCMKTDLSTNGYNTSSYAYYWGKVRTGTYDNIGSSIGTDTASNDELSWGGTGAISATGKFSYLVDKYTDGDKLIAAHLTCNTCSFKLDMDGEFDMTEYGNGFRGIGTTFEDNKTNKVTQRSMPIHGLTGNGSVVTMNRCAYEYSDDETGWWTQGMGLFPLLYFNQDVNINVSDLTIKGMVDIYYKQTKHFKDWSDKTYEISGKKYNYTPVTYTGECSAGGFSGVTANGCIFSSNNSNFTLKNLTLDELQVRGAKYAGGMIAVVGASTRITYNDGITLINNNGTMNFIIDSCHADTIRIQGAYAAGGFIGVYANKKGSTKSGFDGFQAGSNEKKLTVKGDTTIKGKDNGENRCEIGWIKDACYNAYVLLKFAKSPKTNKNISKTCNFSGAGAVVGMSCCDMEIKLNGMAYTDSDTDRENCNVENIYLYDPPFAYNCDYGLGALVGMIPDGNGSSKLLIDNVIAKNIRTELVIDPQYQGMHKKYYEDTGKAFYIAPATGGLTGYIKVPQTITNTRIYDTQIYNGAYTGVFVGSCANSLTIQTNCVAENDIVYSENSNAYDGPPRAGVLVGGTGASNKSFVFGPGITINGCTVVTDGRSSIMMGGAKDGKQTFNIADVSVINSKAVTTRRGAEAIPFIGNNTDPSAETAAASTTVLSHVSGAGTIIGLSYKADYLNFGSIGINAYNLLIKDSLVGYYCGDTELSQYNIQDADISKNTVGVIKDATTEYTYSQIENGEAKLEECIAKDSKGSYLGMLTGGVNNANEYIVAGLCVKGGYYPYYLNGNGNTAINTKDKTNQYIVFSDYELNQENKTVVPFVLGNTAPTKISPYLTINPAVDIKIDGIDGVLSSDGISLTAKDKIIEEYKERNGYSYVSAEIQKFAPDGIYEKNVSTYSAEKAKDGIASGYEGDFPVLVIDKNDPAEVSDLVNSYISMLTNCQHTVTKPINAVTTRTFRWNEDSFEAWDYKNRSYVDSEAANAFDDYSSSLNVSDDLKTWSVNPNVYDNSYDQFTLIDVQYLANGKYYHLEIPVIVQKVQEFSFYASILNGTDYYLDAYGANTKAVLTRNGERITARLDYNYYGDREYWSNLINIGTNMNFSYNKELNLGVSKLPQGTKFTLLDVQNGGYAYQADYASNDLDFGIFRSLEDGALWKSDMITSLLPLAAVKDSKTGDGYVYSSKPKNLTNVYTRSDAASATICIYGDNGSEEYYKFNASLAPTEIKEGTAVTGYKFPEAFRINVTDDSAFKHEPVTDKAYISESYFLTIYFPEDYDEFINNKMSFDKASMSTTPANTGIPTQIVNAAPVDNSELIFAMSQQGQSGIPYNQVNKDNCYVSGKLFDTNNIIFSYDQDVKYRNQPNEDISTKGGMAYIHLEEQIKYSKNSVENFADTANIEVLHQFSVSPNYINEEEEQIADNYPVGLPYEYTIRILDASGNRKGEEITGSGTVTGSNTESITIPTRDIRQYLRTDSYITVAADVILDYSDEALMSAQFPMKPHTSLRPGIKYSADYQLRFTDNGTNVYNETEMDKTIFAIDQMNNATLVYYAYDNIDIGNGVGNIGQLGINPSDPELNFNLIYTESDYDYSSIADKADAKKIKYEFVLKQKQADNEYAAVDDISNYLTDFTLTPEKSAAPEGAKDSADKSKYVFVRDLTEEERSSSLDKSVVTYHVNTGDEHTDTAGNDFEKNSRFYANYKVELTVTLLDDDGRPIANSEGKDYIIYTNARIYPHFIGNAS